MRSFEARGVFESNSKGELDMSERNELIKRMAAALYEWCTTRTSATWEGKRSGLSIPSLDGLQAKSCSAFRAWVLHAHDGVCCFSMDGNYHRAGRDTGGVKVLVGEGKFVFPHNDSCSQHSLAMSINGDGMLVNVTNEPTVNWEPRIESMAETLERCAAELKANIERYDREQADAEQLRKQSAIAAAAAVV